MCILLLCGLNIMNKPRTIIITGHKRGRIDNCGKRSDARNAPPTTTGISHLASRKPCLIPIIKPINIFYVKSHAGNITPISLAKNKAPTSTINAPPILFPRLCSLSHLFHISFCVRVSFVSMTLCFFVKSRLLTKAKQ